VEDFRAHLKIVKSDTENSGETSYHVSAPSASQMSALVERKQAPAYREPFVCPLCECVPKSIAPLVPRGELNVADKLAEHIANHLKSLVLETVAFLDDNSGDRTKSDSQDASQEALAESEESEQGGAKFDRRGDVSLSNRGHEKVGSITEDIPRLDSLAEDVSKVPDDNYSENKVGFNTLWDKVKPEFVEARAAMQDMNDDRTVASMRSRHNEALGMTEDDEKDEEVGWDESHDISTIIDDINTMCNYLRSEAIKYRVPGLSDVLGDLLGLLSSMTLMWAKFVMRRANLTN
jgi:hypothetical protein